MSGIKFCSAFVLTLFISFVQFGDSDVGQHYGQIYGPQYRGGHQYPNQYQLGYGRQCFESSGKHGSTGGSCTSRTGSCGKAVTTVGSGTIEKRFCNDLPSRYTHGCQYQQMEFLGEGFKEAYVCICSDRDYCNSAIFAKSCLWLVLVAFFSGIFLKFRL